MEELKALEAHNAILVKALEKITNQLSAKTMERIAYSALAIRREDSVEKVKDIDNLFL